MAKMIERLKNSLFAPKNTAAYGQDKAGRVLLYLAFWIILISIPFTIDIFKTPLFGVRYQEVMKDAFEKSEKIDVEVVDNQLISSKETPYVVNIKDLNLTLLFDEELKVSELTNVSNLQSIMIWLGREKVYLLYQPAQGFNFMTFELAPYEKLENINNLDFSKALNPNDSAFWGQFFNAMDEIINLHLTRIRLTYVFITFFESLGVLITSIILVSLLIKLFKGSLPITFKEIFKVVTYAHTPYALGLLLGMLYNISWIDDIAMIVSVIFANIASNELVKNKIIKNQNQN